ncbi:XdhC family protein [Propionivibrio dicarboxylicus]|uniref:Xanthine dehydrogenase accessory factor n=1 Tax=Propionivibrio dicarboxylicus TaxID=83767 RepID=A0A1G7WYI2_9RHOO|nr:XdhC/CoxI family protein [Propionivibrio dicarboxylicus]SDG76380.1 xanthine dehydrogenase accessory factor [Propionivibrio dicarboxylicus]
MDHTLFKAITDSRQRITLATIIDVKGSSPRHAGTKMLVGYDGTRTGTIGGGKSEARTLDACRQSRESGRSLLLETKMLGDGTASTEMICGGTHRVLIEAAVDPEPYRQALALHGQGKRLVFVKRLVGTPNETLDAVETSLIDAEGGILCGPAGSIDLERVARALQSGAPSFDTVNGLYYEPLLPEEKLLLLGSGHVGQAVARTAASAGFRVTVIDDRPEIIDAARFDATIRTVVAPYEQAIAEFAFDAATYVVIVTRGHHLDLQCLRAILTRDYRYAGIMGSRRKTRILIEQAITDGFDPEKIDALCTPIGLDIGAESPEELAIAIVAEMIAFRRNARILPALQHARKARRPAPAVN